MVWHVIFFYVPSVEPTYVIIHQIYYEKPKASADNSALGMDDSSYPAQPHPIIVYL